MTTTIECPHCGSECSIDAKELAGGSRLNHRCNHCGSSFVVNTRHAPAQAFRKQVAAIAVIDGPARGQVFRLRQARNLIGRTDADVVVRDPEVSRRHCVIELKGTTAIVVDLDTTNGTYVEGKRIDSCTLKHLAKFRIGASTLVFTLTNKRADESRVPATLVARSVNRK